MELGLITGMVGHSRLGPGETTPRTSAIPVAMNERAGCRHSRCLALKVSSIRYWRSTHWLTTSGSMGPQCVQPLDTSTGASREVSLRESASKRLGPTLIQ